MARPLGQREEKNEQNRNIRRAPRDWCPNPKRDVFGGKYYKDDKYPISYEIEDYEEEMNDLESENFF